MAKRKPTIPVGPWPVFEIEVYGYAPEVFTAATRSKAVWRAYDAFRSISTRSFGEFLFDVRVRLVDPDRASRLAADGYENVRAQYGVHPVLGERRLLINEGPQSGREVTVLYPGRHTSMIHCVYVGEARPMIVHPMNAVREADIRWRKWLEAQAA